MSAAGFFVPATKRETDLIAVFNVSDARTVIILLVTNSLQTGEHFRYNGLFSYLSEIITPPPPLAAAKVFHQPLPWAPGIDLQAYPTGAGISTWSK